jgi:hypothetical protein
MKSKTKKTLFFKKIICLFLFPFLLLGLFSCEDTSNQIIIDGNKPPDDTTISQSLQKNYISRLYIDLLGRKPTSQEELAALQALENKTNRKENRKNAVSLILNKAEYFSNEITILNSVLLNNIPTREIDGRIYVFNLLLQDQNNAAAFDFYRYELARLIKLKTAAQEFTQKRINIKEVYTRYISNNLYDQINMGSENYVISTFQHFLLRAPTKSELEEGVRMVDNFPSKSFLQNGKSKEDYNTALMNSIGYYEGQTRLLFQRFLFRDATSEEIGTFAKGYSETQNYQDLQTQILISDEYAGF